METNPAGYGAKSLHTPVIFLYINVEIIFSQGMCISIFVNYFEFPCTTRKLEFTLEWDIHLEVLELAAVMLRGKNIAFGNDR